MQQLCLIIVLAPLIASVGVGLFGRVIGRRAAHWATNIGVSISFFVSAYVLYLTSFGQIESYNENLYTWLSVGSLELHIGFLVDNLTAIMMVVVTFVSWMVHIYTIGYMSEDDGYQRFFSYISLFTFSMLMLVMSNNFIQLFFGWEAVGLVSYLLIGFWYHKPTAIFANLKAFLVNRVGDFGFLLGIAGILMVFNSLDYQTVFTNKELVRNLSFTLLPGVEWSAITVLCVLLFIGAMGKSAQVPLHVWLPDSMEGPTPISALIHAATMVTAGIFMVARMSPLFEMSEMALNFILVVGTITAFFMGILGLVQNDIKRVVAYSTLSQLGYMTVALGVSAYSAAIFHLFTHAFFKALLFLAAGSVIIGMHHEQDMRKMGGLRRYMPLTYWTSLVGTLALIGFPGFSGFFSKDIIIEAVHMKGGVLAQTVYWALLVGVFITSFYSFRLFFMVFHGEERFDQKTREHLHESPPVVTFPLVALSVPSIFIGAITIGLLLFGNFFDKIIFVNDGNNVLVSLGETFHGPVAMIIHGFVMPPFWLALAGIGTSWYFYLKNPGILTKLVKKLTAINTVLAEKYGFDRFNSWFFAGGARGLGGLFWTKGDISVIDGFFVNGSARLVAYFSSIVRRLQSGYLYDYAFGMLIGLLVFLFLSIYR